MSVSSEVKVRVLGAGGVTMYLDCFFCDLGSVAVSGASSNRIWYCMKLTSGPQWSPVEN